MGHRRRRCDIEKEVEDSNIAVNINSVDNDIFIALISLILGVGQGEGSLREHLNSLLEPGKEKNKSLFEALEALKK